MEIDDALYRLTSLFFLFRTVLLRTLKNYTFKNSSNPTEPLLPFTSRQRYVLGDGALQRLAASRVLLVGMAPLGFEVGQWKGWSRPTGHSRALAHCWWC